ADRNRSHWSTSKTPSYTKSVSWQHHPRCELNISKIMDKQQQNSEIKRAVDTGNCCLNYVDKIRNYFI
ncbi:hypothetical protein, partial [Escherichia coli]